MATCGRWLTASVRLSVSLPISIRLSRVNLDLTALPVDVDALHRLVRELAAQVADDDIQLAAARAEVERLRCIIQRLQRSEMLDFVPARSRVLHIRRPKYGCRACGTIHQAPAPERPIAKGMASPGLLAHVLVSKYCDHTPLYRQTRSSLGTASRSTVRPWQTGLGVRAGG